MTIQEMHYDFKKKINKVDSQQNKNFLIPEIDWGLNEAQELFVKMVAKPRLRNHLGFEKNQRTIDDIRTLVVNQKDGSCVKVTENVATLPLNYWHYLRGEVTMSKGECKGVKGRLHIRQHDDEFENSPFDKSSFEWRVINGTFFEEGIRLYNDGTFTNDTLCLSYIKKLQYIHNAEDYRGGTYNLPNGTILTGTVDSELPEHTHREIVDIAVLIITGEINSPDYQIKMQKLNFNQIK